LGLSKAMLAKVCCFTALGAQGRPLPSWIDLPSAPMQGLQQRPNGLPFIGERQDACRARLPQPWRFGAGAWGLSRVGTA